MYIKVPTQISLYRLIEDVHHVGAAHRHMMLEAVLTDILHQLLQVINLSDSDTSVHSVWIIGNLTLAEVCLDTALRVIGGDAEEGERTARHFGIDGTKVFTLPNVRPSTPRGPNFRSFCTKDFG